MRISDGSSDVGSPDLRTPASEVSRVRKSTSWRRANARLTAPSRAAFSKGFSRKSTAPLFMACTATDTSPWPVRTMTGMLTPRARSEEHTSELQSLMRISYAVFCLKKKKNRRCSTRADAYSQQTRKNTQHQCTQET